MTEEKPTYELAINHQELTPSVWGMLEKLALSSYQSRAFNIRNRDEAAMKMLFCYENRLPLSAANTGLYSVNGRLGVMANIIAAQVRRHPDYDYEVKTLTDTECTIVILRRNGDGSFKPAGESTFTMADASKAGLSNKDNWKNYPRNMLFSRAISNAQRWFAPDVFSQQVYVPEELGLALDDDGNVIEGEARPVTLTLDLLLERWSPEEIMTANEGNIPSTQQELEATRERLEEASNPALAPERPYSDPPVTNRMYK